MFNKTSNDLIRKFKIKGMISDKDFENLPFGRQIEYFKQFASFKSGAKSAWISQKRTTNKKAISEFLKLHDATEYYCTFHDGDFVRDDSFEIFYK